MLDAQLWYHRDLLTGNVEVPAGQSHSDNHKDGIEIEMTGSKLATAYYGEICLWGRL